MSVGKFPRFLAYSHLWIALAAASQGMLTRILAQREPWHPVLAVIFFATLGTYTLQRLGRFKDAPGGDIYGWMTVHRRSITVIAALSIFIATAGAMLMLNINWIIICGILLFISTAYFFTGPRRNPTLRQIPLLKIFLITIIWTVVTVLLPLAVESIPLPRYELLLLLLERFIFIFAVTIPFDIKDVFHDRNAGILTIPGAIGASGSMRLFRILIITWSVIITLHSCLGIFITAGEACGLLISTTLAAWVIDRQLLRRHELYFLFWIDGLLIFQPLIVFLFVLLE